ncbi:hypothetical protein IIC65_04110, partial [Candidatus Sumerlaeota bacterium]|nr:hypothetical protein [Candidatus Sumerlaeota bacterium]
ISRDSETEFKARSGGEIPPDSLFAGLYVEIEGTLQEDGSILAEVIEVIRPEDDVSVEAAIQSVVSNDTYTTLTIAGLTVVVDAETEIDNDAGEILTAASLVIGEFVEAEGQLRDDGSILAREIGIEGDPPAELVELQARIQSVVRGEADAVESLTLAGLTVTLSAQTRIFDDDDAAIDSSLLDAGLTIEVIGLLQQDGTIAATVIEAFETFPQSPAPPAVFGLLARGALTPGLITVSIQGTDSKSQTVSAARDWTSYE